VISLISEAITRGARQSEACRIVGITARTLERWKQQQAGGQDRRRGPNTPVPHRLSEAEKDEALAHANRPHLRNLSPEAVVATLADEDIFICSERSLRRIQKERGQAAYRGRTKPASVPYKPHEYVATEALRVMSWDITYLSNSRVRGSFFFLYMYVDVWSRRILGWAVHEEQSSECAAKLLLDVCSEHAIEANAAVLHQDNGAPMKGATFLATLDALGITKSFSRPRVSDDNAYIEALFRHLKYVPNYPRGGFASLEEANAWVARFVAWYNHHHLHSAIGFVTPDDRHHGRDIEILAARKELYNNAQQRNPRRWTGAPRKWDRPLVVTLNPDRTIETRPAQQEQIA
jgi:transposase InsO family protein